MTTEQADNLQALLDTHSEMLMQLLPPDLWGLRPVEVKEYSGQFTKYTLGQMPDGRWAHLHHFTGPDRGAPHCHPCPMKIYVLTGSCLERVYYAGGTEDILHEAGSSYFIAPARTHSIIDLPQGEYWSLVFTGEVVRDWQHYPELLQAA